MISKEYFGEGKNIEFKQELPSKHEKFLKDIIAFANTSGGKTIIGIVDETKEVVGIGDQFCHAVFVLAVSAGAAVGGGNGDGEEQNAETAAENGSGHSFRRFFGHNDNLLRFQSGSFV